LPNLDLFRAGCQRARQGGPHPGHHRRRTTCQNAGAIRLTIRLRHCDSRTQGRQPGRKSRVETIIGDWDNPDSLLKLGALADVITLENEFVDADSLAALEQSGHSLWPTSSTVRVVQDKLFQKRALADAGLPVPQFGPAPDKASVVAAAKKFGWPLLLKKRRNGYDGKGNFTVRSAAEIDEAWTQLNGDANALYVEEFCPFTLELAMMITRSRDGETACYPVVETVQRDHICHLVKAPAPIPAEMASRAADIARKAVETVGCVGAMGVEMFLARDGKILINELAPRVHNSGHYTIEGCVCSNSRITSVRYSAGPWVPRRCVPRRRPW